LRAPARGSTAAPDRAGRPRVRAGEPRPRDAQPARPEPSKPVPDGRPGAGRAQLGTGPRRPARRPMKRRPLRGPSLREALAIVDDRPFSLATPGARASPSPGKMSRPRPRPCPSNTELVELAEGQLDEAALARLQEHVAGCRVCAGVVAGLGSEELRAVRPAN